MYAGIAVLTVGLAAGSTGQAPHPAPAQPLPDRTVESTTVQAPTTVVPTPKKNAFRRLQFVPGQQPAPQGPSHPQPADATDRSPRVVCGMVVMPADPKVDPAIVIPLPENTNRFSMRVITAPVCR
jgi:hypothetical protein